MTVETVTVTRRSAEAMLTALAAPQTSSPGDVNEAIVELGIALDAASPWEHVRPVLEAIDKREAHLVDCHVYSDGHFAAADQLRQYVAQHLGALGLNPGEGHTALVILTALGLVTRFASNAASARLLDMSTAVAMDASVHQLRVAIAGLIPAEARP